MLTHGARVVLVGRLCQHDDGRAGRAYRARHHNGISSGVMGVITALSMCEQVRPWTTDFIHPESSFNITGNVTTGNLTRSHPANVGRCTCLVSTWTCPWSWETTSSTITTMEPSQHNTITFSWHVLSVPLCLFVDPRQSGVRADPTHGGVSRGRRVNSSRCCTWGVSSESVLPSAWRTLPWNASFRGGGGRMQFNEQAYSSGDTLVNRTPSPKLTTPTSPNFRGQWADEP
jgi:hypothetical protein